MCLKGCWACGIGKIDNQIYDGIAISYTLQYSNKIILLQFFSDLTDISFSIVSLRPSTQQVLALVAELTSLEKHKEHLRVNLDRAEEEGSLRLKVVPSSCPRVVYEALFSDLRWRCCLKKTTSWMRKTKSKWGNSTENEIYMALAENILAAFLQRLEKISCIL